MHCDLDVLVGEHVVEVVDDHLVVPQTDHVENCDEVLSGEGDCGELVVPVDLGAEADDILVDEHIPDLVVAVDGRHEEEVGAVEPKARESEEPLVVVLPSALVLTPSLLALTPTIATTTYFVVVIASIVALATVLVYSIRLVGFGGEVVVVVLVEVLAGELEVHRLEDPGLAQVLGVEASEVVVEVVEAFVSQIALCD